VSGSVVWPRVPRGRAIELWRAQAAVPAEQARLSARSSHRFAAPVPWGDPAAEARIADVQVELRSVADASGWPRPIPPDRRAEVDRAWGHVLHQRMAIAPTDAAHEGGWSFLALVVVPDLAFWRFRGGDRRRFIGVTDHVFARLWWRELVLGAEVVDGDGGAPLTEDEHVALSRRADLVASSTVARAIARGIMRSGGADAARLARMKTLTLDLLRLSPSLCLDALDEGQLDDLVTELLARPISSG
jgi:hypothetical protein